MRHKILQTLLVTIMAALAISESALGDAGNAFIDITVEEARARASEEGKILLIDYTEDSRLQCKLMNQNTWANQDVIDWMAEHAIAIQIDIRKQPEQLGKFGLMIPPAILIIKDGEVFDRNSGYVAPDKLLKWLEAVQGGKRRIDLLREEAERGGHVDVDARYALAQQFVQTGEYDEATKEYVWLWNNIVAHQPSMHGVRSSFMAGDMKKTANAYAPAREQFTQLRDEAARRITKQPNDDDARDDWMVLNEVIGDEDATLAWFDSIKNDPSQERYLNRISYRLEDLLIARGRWADLGMIISDPLAQFDQDLAMFKMTTSRELPENLLKMKDDLEDSGQRYFRNSVATLYTSLLAAQRENDATKLAARAFDAYDHVAKLKTALIRTALGASQPRPIHLEWAREAGEAGEATDGLIRRLEKALQ